MVFDLRLIGGVAVFIVIAILGFKGSTKGKGGGKGGGSNSGNDSTGTGV